MTDADAEDRLEPKRDPTRTPSGVVPAAPMDVAPELFPAPTGERDDCREGDA